MAMNWGAFAGGAATSALGTYAQMNSERLKNLQTALFMEDMADKQELKKASQETFGRVGKDQYENINSILEAKGAEVAPEAAAIEKPAAPVKYTEQQAAQDYGLRLSAIDPVRGFQFKGQALQAKAAQRQSDIDDKYDELNKWRDESLAMGFSTLEGKGMSGMPDVLNPQLKKMGVTVEYKSSGQGPGSLVAKDAEGKVVGTYTGLDQVKNGFRGLVAKEYESRLVGLLGSADKALNYTLQREKLEVERRVADSTIAKNRATGDYYTNSLKGMGQPIGKDSDNKSVFMTKDGPVYSDRTPVGPDVDITPWNQGVKDQLTARRENVTIKGPDGKPTTMVVDIVTSLSKDGKINTKVTDLDGNPVENPSEIIKQIVGKQAPKELNPIEQDALKAYYASAAKLAQEGMATPKALEELARTLGVTNLILSPVASPVQNIIKKVPQSAWESVFGPPLAGSSKNAPASKESPPTQAIPKEKPLSAGEQNVRRRAAEIEAELPEMTLERAREIKDSRGYIVLPSDIKRKVEEVIKSKEPPPRTLYSPR